MKRTERIAMLQALKDMRTEGIDIHITVVLKLEVSLQKERETDQSNDQEQESIETTL
jgi:hypothetical protein